MGQMAGDGDLRAGWEVNVRLRSQPRAGLCCRASDYGGSEAGGRTGGACDRGTDAARRPPAGRPEAGHAPPAAAAADCRWMRRAGGIIISRRVRRGTSERLPGSACPDKNSARMLSMTRH